MHGLYEQVGRINKRYEQMRRRPDFGESSASGPSAALAAALLGATANLHSEGEHQGNLVVDLDTLELVIDIDALALVYDAG